MEDETVRLVLMEGGEDAKIRREKINQGAAHMMIQWSKILSSAWSIFVVMSSFLLLFALALYIHSTNPSFEEEDEEMDEEEWNSVPSGTVISKIRKKKLNSYELSNDIFFIRTKDLDVESACCIESALKLCPDKDVYLMFLSKARNSHHERRLREAYSNLNVIRTEGSKYLKGSVFSGQWNWDEKSLFAAKVLTEWQFGGAVISDGLLMYTRKIFDPEGFCKVHPKVFYCQKQCPAFIYDLMNSTESSMKKDGESTEDIIAEALIKFCGSPKYLDKGCEGGTRLEPSSICDNPQDDCAFIRLSDFKRNNGDWESRLPMFCPEVMKEENIMR